MFKQLAYAQHMNEVTADHNKMIIETASEVISTDEPDDPSISMDDLDAVMNDDAGTVTQEELDDLESKIGEITINQPSGDITTMSKKEIEDHIKNVAVPTIPELMGGVKGGIR